MIKVINFYGGPGSGKSTQAAGLFYKMKAHGYNVELTDEFAKECVWEDNVPMLRDQLWVLAHQHRKILRLVDKVDYVITDSPVLLSPIYREKYGEALYSEIIDKMALECYNLYDNINFLLKRPTEYNQAGRSQNLSASIEIDEDIIEQFKKFNISYTLLGEIDQHTVDKAFDYIRG
jgi:thymidylate kinase